MNSTRPIRGDDRKPAALNPRLFTGSSVIFIVVLIGGCGGNTPATPVQPTLSGPPSGATIPPRSVSGTVTDGVTGMPIPNAVVFLDSSLTTAVNGKGYTQTSTDVEGKYRIDGLLRGEDWITVRLGGYAQP